MAFQILPETLEGVQRAREAMTGGWWPSDPLARFALWWNQIPKDSIFFLVSELYLNLYFKLEVMLYAQELFMPPPLHFSGLVCMSGESKSMIVLSASVHVSMGFLLFPECNYNPPIAS